LAFFVAFFHLASPGVFERLLSCSRSAVGESEARTQDEIGDESRETSSQPIEEAEEALSQAVVVSFLQGLARLVYFSTSKCATASIA